MMNMCWEIKIGTYKLGLIESVEITRSVEALSDVATIVLPATAYNKVLDFGEKIKRGDTVNIRLGYDEKLVNEFDGFVESVSTDGGSFKIMCEDGIFQYRKSLPNKEIKNASVKDILTYVHQTVTGFTVNCDYEFTYDKFVFQDCTGYDVLKKIQEEANPNIYLKGNSLEIHPKYIEIFGKANYDFAKNIDSEGCDLKYKNAEDRLLMVKVKSKGQDGKDISAEYGKLGGDEKTYNFNGGITDVASLKLKAIQAYNERVYTGYEGSFTAWLIPYCDAGYNATLIDSDYPEKNGHYYVLEVKVEFSNSGGKRVIKLGKKLSNG